MTTTRHATAAPVDVNERTDVALPYGPGAGKRLGPTIYGGYTDLIG